jgi:hypothetical protein
MRSSQQGAEIVQNYATCAGNAQDILVVQVGQRSRHRLKRQAEVVADITPAHRQRDHSSFRELLMAGVGWSLVQIGVSRLLYDGARRSRLALGLHDTVILGAALTGALSAGL